MKRNERIGFLADHPRNHALAETLRMRGFEVHVPAADGGDPPACDLWIVCLDDPAEVATARGLRPLHADLPWIALAAPESPEAERLAEELETTAVVEHPGRAGAFGALAQRVELVFDPLAAPTEPGIQGYARTYPANAHGAQRGARDLAAFLTEKGVAHAHRIRIASAVCEIADNVRRHAYGAGDHSFEVEVELKRTRVNVAVSDQGRGFDAERVHLDSIPAPLPTTGHAHGASMSTGLQRVSALSEELVVRSDPSGTRVELFFELTPVRFEEEREGFAEVDFLDPRRARDLLRSLQEGAEDLGNIAPALALTVGRLLGGAQQRGRTQA